MRKKFCKTYYYHYTLLAFDAAKRGKLANKDPLPPPLSPLLLSGKKRSSAPLPPPPPLLLLGRVLKENHLKRQLCSLSLLTMFPYTKAKVFRDQKIGAIQM